MNGLGNKAIMSQNIRYYMGKTGKSQKEICDDLGFKTSTFSTWVVGSVYPRIDKIEILANYFGISKADLIEERGTRDNVSEIMQHLRDSPKHRILLDSTQKLDEKDLEALIIMANRLKGD